MRIDKNESIINILLFILIFVIFYLVYKSKFSIKDKPQCVNEKFTVPPTTAQNAPITSTLQYQVDSIFDKVYDIDVEACKNMGAICKTLLTGSGYYISPEKQTATVNQEVGSWGISFEKTFDGEPTELNIPATLIMEKDLVINGDLELSGTLIINNGCVTVTTGGPNFIPEGTIMPFYGEAINVPVGWLLCDGKNGTPNLQGRSLYYGYEDLYGSGFNDFVSFTYRQANQYGGGNTHILQPSEIPPHNHKTVNLPSFSLSNPGGDYNVYPVYAYNPQGSCQAVKIRWYENTSEGRVDKGLTNWVWPKTDEAIKAIGPILDRCVPGPCNNPNVLDSAAAAYLICSGKNWWMKGEYNELLAWPSKGLPTEAWGLIPTLNVSNSTNGLQTYKSTYDKFINEKRGAAAGGLSGTIQSTSHNNLPPSFVLNYIIRVGDV